MTRLRSITTLICFASCTGIFAQSLEGQLGAPIKGQPGTVKGGSYVIMGITGTDVGTLSVFSHGFPARALEDNDVVQRGPSSKIYEVVAPAVVLVVVRTGNDQYATGSGSVIHRDGYIITSAHVVGRERQVVVIFKPVLEGAKPSEADTRTAEVVRLNEVTDLALLKVKSLPARIKPVPLGTLASVKVGADVHAIGHPQGESWTYTKGVVSQLRRDYEAHFGDRTIRATVIQTQTPINPGNSGGPLLDDNGNLIGVNAFVNREAQGLNYAISVEEVMQLVRADASVLVDVQSSPKQNAAPVCRDQKPVEQGRDEANRRDYFKYDLNCDGYAEATLLRPDNPKSPIMLQMEMRRRGHVDIVIVDENRDGKWDYSLIDTDFDGKPDLIGYHDDGGIVPTRTTAYKDR